MLFGASMPVESIGSTVLWIANVTVDSALVVIGRVMPGEAGRQGQALPQALLHGPANDTRQTTPALRILLTLC